MDGSLVPCLPFLLKNYGSSTEGWCSDRAVQKGTQPGSRAELSTLSRKSPANPALCFPKEELEVRELKTLTKIIQQKMIRGKLNGRLAPGPGVPSMELALSQTHTIRTGPGEASSWLVASLLPVHPSGLRPLANIVTV